MSITVPDRPESSPQVDGDRPAPPSDSSPEGGVLAQPARPDVAVRVGRLDLGPVSAYLLAWTLVLFVVEVLAFWATHEVLHRLGVLDAVSRTTATVLAEPVPDSGVLPELEFAALLPYVVMLAAGLAVLWLLTSLSVVLVHNAICAVTGGPRVHVR